MKAVRVHQFGGLDAMVYQDMPQPRPGSGEISGSGRRGRRGPVGCLGA